MMYDRLMKHTAILSIIFTLVAMTIMLYTAVNAPVVIEESNVGNMQQSVAKVLKSDSMKELSIDQGSNQDTYLCIPLAGTTTDDKLTVEADYVNQQVSITIREQDENYYSKNKITGNGKAIDKILWNDQGDTTQLLLQLNGVYEHNAFCKNNMLYLEFQTPREKYEKILVVDAGSIEGDITSNIVKKLKAKFTDTHMKVYYTGIDHTDASVDKKVTLANQVKADMLISIQIREDMHDDRISGVQAIYNPTFFIPYLNSIQLSDVLERTVCQYTGAKANGLLPGDEKNVLVNQATIPVTMIQIGDIGNKEDRALLEEDTFQDKVAEGIYQGIQAAYQEIEEGKEQ